jgi:hypothetical protein
MHHAACATATYAPPPRPFTRASTQRQTPSAAENSSPVTHHCPILIASPVLEIDLTSSQQTRKHFLIASFYGTLAQPSRPAHLNSFPATFLTATHPNSEIPQTHESKQETIF